MFWCREKGNRPTVRFVGTQGYWANINDMCGSDLEGYWAGPITGSFVFEDDTEKETDRFVVVDRLHGLNHTVVEITEYETLQNTTGEKHTIEVKKRLETAEGQPVGAGYPGQYVLYGKFEQVEAISLTSLENPLDEPT